MTRLLSDTPPPLPCFYRWALLWSGTDRAYIKNIKEDTGQTDKHAPLLDFVSRSSPCLPDGGHLRSTWTFWAFGPQISPSPPGLWGMRQSRNRSSSRLHPPLLFRCHSPAPLHHNPGSPAQTVEVSELEIPWNVTPYWCVIGFHFSSVLTNLNISFLTVRLALPLSLLVFVLLAAGTFSFVSAPVPVLPPFSVPVLLTLLVLLFLFLVTVNRIKLHFCPRLTRLFCFPATFSEKWTNSKHRHVRLKLLVKWTWPLTVWVTETWTPSVWGTETHCGSSCVSCSGSDEWMDKVNTWTWLGSRVTLSMEMGVAQLVNKSTCCD